MCDGIAYVLLLLYITNAVHSRAVYHHNVCQIDDEDNIVCGSKIVDPKEFSSANIHFFKNQRVHPEMLKDYVKDPCVLASRSPQIPTRRCNCLKKATFEQPISALKKINLVINTPDSCCQTPSNVIVQKTIEQQTWITQPNSINEISQNGMFQNTNIISQNEVSQNTNGNTNVIANGLPMVGPKVVPRLVSNPNIIPLQHNVIPLNPNSQYDQGNIIEHQEWKSNGLLIPNGYYVNELGQTVDREGNFINQNPNGYRINENGQIVDAQGHIRNINQIPNGYHVNELGQIVDRQGHVAIQNSNGYQINEYGQIVDVQDRIININQHPNGYYVNELGQIVDRQGHVAIQNSNGYHINKYGQIVDVQGHIITIDQNRNSYHSNEFGQLVDGQGQFNIQNSNGYHINEYGQIVDVQGRIININQNPKGYYVNELGQIVDGQDHVNIQNSNGYHINEYGQNVDVQSRIISNNQNSKCYHINEFGQLVEGQGHENIQNLNGYRINEYGQIVDVQDRIISNNQNSNGFHVNENGQFMDPQSHINIDNNSNSYDKINNHQIVENHFIKITDDETQVIDYGPKSSHKKNTKSHSHKETHLPKGGAFYKGSGNKVVGGDKAISIIC